jgi:hypothetical protein
MRLNLNIVNAYLVKQLIDAEAIVDVRANGFDVIHVDLASGETVAIHIIERDIDVRLIKDILATNAKSGFATLFILWCAMLLPEHGEYYLPYDWMSALLTVHNDKIYAYDSMGSQMYIFPVHFEKQDTGLECYITYGEGVNMRNLGAETIHAHGQYIQGTFRIADFDPARGQQQAKTDGKSRYTRMKADRNPMWVYYEVLGVSIDADLETIKKAYHQLARQYHPDLNDAPEANERMQQINTAYTQIISRLDGGENHA